MIVADVTFRHASEFVDRRAHGVVVTRGAPLHDVFDQLTLDAGSTVMMVSIGCHWPVATHRFSVKRLTPTTLLARLDARHSLTTRDQTTLQFVIAAKAPRGPRVVEFVLRPLRDSRTLASITEERRRCRILEEVTLEATLLHPQAHCWSAARRPTLVPRRSCNARLSRRPKA